jgi:hypothetical protein
MDYNTIIDKLYYIERLRYEIAESIIMMKFKKNKYAAKILRLKYNDIFNNYYRIDRDDITLNDEP